MLQVKNSQQYIYFKTLYNFIQKCKPLTPIVLQHDVTNLLNLLKKYQTKIQNDIIKLVLMKQIKDLLQYLDVFNIKTILVMLS